MLQAGLDRAFGSVSASLGRPRGREGLASRRVSGAPRSTQTGSRKVRLVGHPAALHHDVSGACRRTGDGISRRRIRVWGGSLDATEPEVTFGGLSGKSTP